MPKPKPNWGYTNESSSIQNPSAELILAIKEILPMDADTLREVKAQITSAIVMYQISKKHSSRDNRLHPTKGELKAAASSIVEDIESLNNKLSLSAGGIKEFYEYYDPYDTLHRHERRVLEGLVSDLEFLKTCCIDAAKQVDNEGYGNGVTGMPPKKQLVYDIAFMFREVLHLEPTIYIPEDYKQSSQYAKVLAACFMEIDRRVPKNLKALMSWERKQPRDYDKKRRSTIN